MFSFRVLFFHFDNSPFPPLEILHPASVRASGRIPEVLLEVFNHDFARRQRFSQNLAFQRFLSAPRALLLKPMAEGSSQVVLFRKFNYLK